MNLSFKWTPCNWGEGRYQGVSYETNCQVTKVYNLKMALFWFYSSCKARVKHKAIAISHANISFLSPCYPQNKTVMSNINLLNIHHNNALSSAMTEIRILFSFQYWGCFVMESPPHIHKGWAKKTSLCEILFSRYLGSMASKPFNFCPYPP